MPCWTSLLCRLPPLPNYHLQDSRVNVKIVIPGSNSCGRGPTDMSMSEILAIYPGSFDPITNGHLDLIERARRIFGRLIVAVLTNPDKLPLFTAMERVEMLQEATRGMPNVAVDTFGGLLVEYAKQKGAGIILRGIRAFTDYEYELQMAIMNRKLEPSLETVFLVPAESYTYVSSRLVREIFQNGGSVKDLVPPLVEDRLHQKVFQNKI